MFLLGLLNDSPARRGILTTSSPSSGVFSRLNSLIFSATKKLFPPLASIKYLNINNSISGPVSCAADDLELSFGGDQIEFYSSVRRPNGVAPKNTELNHSFKLPADHPVIHQPAMPQYLGFDPSFAVPPKPEVVPLWPQPFISDVGGFQGTYFNDFVPQPRHELSVDESAYGSSVESYVSPLDDDFFRRVDSSPGEYSSIAGSFSESGMPSASVSRASISHPAVNVPAGAPNSLKRKFVASPSISNAQMPVVTPSVAGPPLDEVDVIFNQILVKNQPDFLYVPQSHNHHPKMEPTATSVQVGFNARTKKVKLEEEQLFQCRHCPASFKVKGYLTRHLKKHSVDKAFICPFYQENTSEETSAKCHPTGGFSRRDTYKTHLKAIHFIYPPGTKSVERRSRGGRCAGCFQHFANNKEWLADHIEAGMCKAANISASDASRLAEDKAVKQEVVE